MIFRLQLISILLTVRLTILTFRLLVLSFDRLVDLLSMHGYVLRCLDAKTDSFAINSNNRDDDVVPDDDGLRVFEEATSLRPAGSSIEVED